MNEKIEEAIIDYWGERCKEFDKNCDVCQAWQEYDALTKKAPLRKPLYKPCPVCGGNPKRTPGGNCLSCNGAGYIKCLNKAQN